jgi:hypothetical protein
MIEAGLVTGNTHIDLIRLTRSGLIDELRIRQQRPCHRDHIGVAVRQYFFGHFRCVDAVGRDQRHTHLAPQLSRDPGECSPRHHGGYGRNTGLVPANPGVDQRGTGLLDSFRLGHDLVPAVAVRHQVEHRQAVYDNEFPTRGGADTAHDFDRNPVAVSCLATPLVIPLVDPRCSKFIDEISFRPHHLDAVVTSPLRQPGGAHKALDLTLDSTGGQGAR